MIGAMEINGLSRLLQQALTRVVILQGDKNKVAGKVAVPAPGNRPACLPTSPGGRTWSSAASSPQGPHRSAPKAPTDAHILQVCSYHFCFRWVICSPGHVSLTRSSQCSFLSIARCAASQLLSFGQVQSSFSRKLCCAHIQCVYRVHAPPFCRADRKSTRLNSSHSGESRMPSSA